MIEPVSPELLELEPVVWLLVYGSAYTREPFGPAVVETIGVQVSVHDEPLAALKVNFTSFGVADDPPLVVVR